MCMGNVTEADLPCRMCSRRAVKMGSVCLPQVPTDTVLVAVREVWRSGTLSRPRGPVRPIYGRSRLRRGEKGRETQQELAAGRVPR